MLLRPRLLPGLALAKSCHRLGTFRGLEWVLLSCVDQRKGCFLLIAFIFLSCEVCLQRQCTVIFLRQAFQHCPPKACLASQCK